MDKIWIYVWKQRKLGEIVNRITRKNSKLISELPLTISAQQGLIDQNEFFDKRVASKDVSGYYLIKNGEFAYNKSTSNDAPWGAIKRLDRYENGVLSTLYIVFEIKDETLVNSDFLVAYYSTNLWYKGIHEIAAEGARNHGLLNIAPTDFFKTKLKLPADIEEQQEIGEYFKKIDSLITFHHRKSNLFNKTCRNAWEQRKLGDFGKATGGTSIESEFSEDGIYKVISIGSYSENSVYNDQGIRAIKSDKTSNRVLNRNDLTMILNDKTTSGNIIGRVLLIEESGIYVYNQRTERIEINLDEYDPVFLYEMLNAPNIREKIIKQAQGNTQIYVNWTAISLLEYMIPSKEEQVKIGEYLHSISNLITLHQRKYDETKKLKKCMLQKMFPKEGEKVPEIRFSGFTGDWKQRKLGEIIEVCSGRDYKHLEKGNVPVYGTGGYMLSVSKALSADKDAVGIGRKGTIDKPYILKAPFWTVDTLFYCVSKKDCDLNFIFDIFQNINWKALDESTGVPSLSKAVINKVKVLIPSVVEQIKIGRYFSLLDNRITFHQQKCDELKNIKKFMLQNMFVSEK